MRGISVLKTGQPVIKSVVSAVTMAQTLDDLVMWGGQTALSFAHHLTAKEVGKKSLPTLAGFPLLSFLITKIEILMYYIVETDKSFDQASADLE